MSILKGISSAGARVVQFITAGLKEGISASSILETLKTHELGYRRSDFFSDVRILTGAERAWSGLRYVRKDYTPDIRHYLETKSPLTTNYQTVVEARGFDVVTGEDYTRRVTIGRDTLVSRETLEEDALNAMREESPTKVVESMLLVEGRKCPFRWEF